MQLNQGWLKRVGSYPILSIPIKTWFIILAILGCVFGSIFFIIFQEISHPPIFETFTAEVTRLWIEQHEDESGGFRVYRVRLKQEEEELICTVPSIKIDVWRRLETGASYEFAVSKTARGCYVNEAVKIEETGPFRLGN